MTSTRTDPPSSGDAPAFPWLIAALILLATTLAYMPAFSADWIWDDDLYVTRNRTLIEPGGLARIWLEPGATPQYYPLTFTTFWIERRLWGLDPRGYHVLNVLLHAAAAVLFGRLLQRLAVPGAWAAALLFAVHPVNVESVAWITERKNTLSGVFHFLAALLMVRILGLTAQRGGHETTPLHEHSHHSRTRTAAQPPRSRAASSRVTYVVGALCFIGALLSKTTTATLPAALLLLVWWRRGRITRRDLWVVAPLFAAALVLAWITIRTEVQDVGATGPELEPTWAERCIIAGRATWFYAGKLLWPHPLSFVYPRWSIDAAAPASYAAPIAAVLLPIGLWGFRRRIGRGPVTAVLLFGGTLLPALGFIPFYWMHYSFVADHFAYLPAAALIALFCGLAAHIMRRLDAANGTAFTRRVAGAVGLGLAIVAVSMLASLSWRHARSFRNAEALWLKSLSINPTAALAHNNLGNLYRTSGRAELAIPHLKRAAELKPQWPEALSNLAAAYVDGGRFEEAIAAAQRALRIDAGFASAHHNLAMALQRIGRWTEAIEHLRRALVSRPNRLETVQALGEALAARGDPAEAESLLQRVRAARPGDPAVLNNLALTFIRRERHAEAIDLLQEAAAISPETAVIRHSLGKALLGVGRATEAAREFNAAARLDPRFVAPATQSSEAAGGISG